MPNMSAPEEYSVDLAPLLSALLEGQLSEPQRAQLTAVLRDSMEARQFYLGYLETHALLRAELGVTPMRLQPQELADLCSAALTEQPENLSDGHPSVSPLRRATALADESLTFVGQGRCWPRPWASSP